MAEDKKTRDSNAPPPDLKSERDRFVKSFSRGSRLTDEFIQDYERLLDRLGVLETENGNLRAQVAADRAVRELVQKIELLEAEKSDLLSRTNRAEAINNQFTTRVQEVESEFSNLANLYVASNQLHSSLSPRGVTRRIKEVLAQLLGAERYSMYLANEQGTELVPIASEGVPGGDLVPVTVAGSRLGDVFTKGEAAVEEDSDPSQGELDRPAAIIPLVVDERVVGVIAIFSTLKQKTRFDAVDFELFRLLGQHAAAALVSASLFAQAERRLPGLEAFLDLSV
ncbi:MAG TPA: GAF domain-containing protein [Polyangiaceae bacterium]|jgi:putative methionine-R-sulfoxide reductase with GAF domain|nr:GAF domain-containing protein [Polyangiaceae bacterium]